MLEEKKDDRILPSTSEVTAESVREMDRYVRVNLTFYQVRDDCPKEIAIFFNHMLDGHALPTVEGYLEQLQELCNCLPTAAPFLRSSSPKTVLLSLIRHFIETPGSTLEFPPAKLIRAISEDLIQSDLPSLILRGLKELARYPDTESIGGKAESEPLEISFAEHTSDRLISLAEHKDPKIRIDALRCLLPTTKGPKVTEVVQKALEDHDPDVKLRTALEISKRDQPAPEYESKIEAIIRERTKCGAPYYGGNAEILIGIYPSCDSLCRAKIFLSDRFDLSVLRDHIQQKDPEVFVPQLLECMTSMDPEVALGAFQIAHENIAKPRWKDNFPPSSFIVALRSNEPQIPELALYCLGCCVQGGQAMPSAVASIVIDMAVSTEATLDMRRLALRYLYHASWFDPLKDKLHKMLQEKDEKAQKAALTILTEIGPDLSDPRIIELLGKKTRKEPVKPQFPRYTKKGGLAWNRYYQTMKSFTSSTNALRSLMSDPDVVYQDNRISLEPPNRLHRSRFY